MPNDNTSKIIAIVGAKRMGKSTLIHELVSDRKDALIYDPESEYERGIFLDIEEFKKIAKNFRDGMVVWEEASSFFDSKIDREIRAMFSRNRHKNVDHLLVFHSLNELPRYILSRTDYIFLFYTKDTHVAVKQKFSGRKDIYEAFIKLQGKKPGKYIEIET